MMKIVQGERGTVVQYVQLALQRAGFSVKADGIFGEETCRALRAFIASPEDMRKYAAREAESDNLGREAEGSRKAGESHEAGEACEVDDAVWKRLEQYLRGYAEYTVRPGDTYFEIAARYRTSMRALMDANPGVGPMFLRPGEIITAPFSFSVVPENVAYSSALVRYAIEGLTARYPFLEAGSIGESVLGKELLYVRIGNGPKELFYSAAFHANEWITTPVLLKFAEEYAKAYAQGGRIGGVRAERLYRSFSLYLAPMVNPDGVDLINGMLDDPEAERKAKEIAAGYPQIPYPNGWKANIRGVDLNLQFPAGWETAKEVKYAQGYISPAPRDFVGKAPLSEPESAAVSQFTQKHRLRLILAYHTQGEVIYWKYRDYEPARSYEIARYFGKVSGYAATETPEESGNAGYKDWFIMTYDRPGYTIEAGMGVSPLPLAQFPRIYQDNLGILVGAMTQSAAEE